MSPILQARIAKCLRQPSLIAKQINGADPVLLCCNCCILAVFAGNPQRNGKGAAYPSASKPGDRRNVTDAVRGSLELPERVSFYKQDDLPGAALFPERVCFRCIAQRQSTTDGQDELAVPHVIRKLTQL